MACLRWMLGVGLCAVGLTIGAGCGSDGGTRAGASDGDAALADGDDVTVFPEVAPDASPDVPDADTGDDDGDTAIAPGAFGAPCEGNVDCDSGYCVEGPSGYLCTRACDTTCPDGFDCRSIPGAADVAFVCVPRLRKLCTPCSDALQCGGGACLDDGVGAGQPGSSAPSGVGACAPPCDASDASTACEAGFVCEPDPSGRQSGTFCQPLTGACACSAARDGGERACSAVSDGRTCYGVEVCDPLVGWGECSAVTPRDEVCNGLDDDCDDAIDEDLAEGDSCQNTVAGVGSCAGTRRCSGTPGWVCDGPLPEPETCDGADEDCDGATDEDFKDAGGAFTLAAHCGGCGNDCTTRFVHGVGRCAGGDGACEVERCDDGYVVFEGQCVAPIDVTCQGCGGDDDCYGGSCVAFAGGDAATVCVMPCGAGRACPDGLACTAFGGVDRCAPASGTCACTAALSGNVRTCEVDNAAGRCFGEETCDGAAWSACSADVPAVEVCNDGDDDCDGQIDEEARWQNRGAACTVGLGACVASGVWRCDANDRTGPTVCSATPGQATAEACNGVDDDCDGATDEGLVAPACPLQGGVCAGAKALCAGQSGFLACNAGNYGADYELVELSCDGLDNDCDGATDEVDLDADEHRPIACGGDDCDDAVKLAHPGLAEVCGDAIDNDCSGGVDDKDGDGDGFVAEACGGDDCDDVLPGVNPDVVEVCGDAKDDDCSGLPEDKDVDGDGERDEACGGSDCDDGDTAVGAGETEVWDGKDNDCDGLVDEGKIPAGTVVVTEVMLDASGGAAGAWLELKNLGASAVNLRSWEIEVGGATITIDEALSVAPGATAVVCRDADFADNGGVGCGVASAALVFGDAAAADVTVALSLDGVEIDRVVIDARYPLDEGRALSLDPTQTTRAGNDVYGNWCAVPLANEHRLTGGDYGTPGRANPACSGAPAIATVAPDNGIEHGGDVLVVTGSGFIATGAVTLGGVACAAFEVVDDTTLKCTAPPHAPGLVDVVVTKGTAGAGGASGTKAGGFRFTGEAVTKITWCDLQYPKTISVAAGAESELVYGQVRAQGVTEPAGAPPGIGGQVGFGPVGTDPRTSPGWRWLDATWNKQFFDNDEFMRVLVIATPGTYSFTYRFSDDGGTSFMYGDYDPGTADGLTTNNLGTITVTAPP